MGGGCKNKNVIHGAPKKGREWRIALSNHYAWLQTRGCKMHKRKRNLDLGWGWVAWHHVLRSLGMWHDGGVVWRIIVEQREGKRKGCEDK